MWWNNVWAEILKDSSITNSRVVAKVGEVVYVPNHATLRVYSSAFRQPPHSVTERCYQQCTNTCTEPSLANMKGSEVQSPYTYVSSVYISCPRKHRSLGKSNSCSIRQCKLWKRCLSWKLSSLARCFNSEVQQTRETYSRIFEFHK